MEIKLPPEIYDPKEIISLWKSFRNEVVECLRKTPASEFTKNPAEGRWSISEVGEHLYITQLNLAESIPKVMTGKSGIEFNGYSPELNYRMIKISLLKPTGVKNPPFVAPLNKYSIDEILPLLEKSETQLSEEFTKYSKKELGGRAMKHPVLGNLNVFDFIWVMAMHENSHLYALKKRTKEF